jgi:hypothetical protein
MAMLVRLGKCGWLQCDDCRHGIMIDAPRAYPTALVRHADAAARRIQGNAANRLSRAERMLWAGAARYTVK